MDKLTINKIIEYCKGKVICQGGDEQLIYDISTDSRTIKKGDLFIALCGDRFDGHNYINEVLNKGIKAIIVSNNANIEEYIGSASGCWIIGVNNTLEAYQRIAKHYLEQFSNIVKIAITGSNGKTTTKDIIKIILSKHFSVLANEGNFNNQVGVPKTVFTVESHHDAVIIEMGAGKKGDIAKLSDIISPDIGIITSIGKAHIEFFGELEGIAKEKKELFKSFHNNSTAILDREEPHYSSLINDIKNKLISFSSKDDMPFYLIKDLGLDGYLINYKGTECSFRLGGKHNLKNLAFAILAAETLNIPSNIIAENINYILPAKMRSEVIKGQYTIIKDCYNANPDSMKAGLDYISSLNIPGKKITVLGDMLELGYQSKLLHEEIGNYFTSLNIDYLLTLGTLAKRIADTVKKSDYLKDKAFSFQAKDELFNKLKKIAKKDDLIYFKASRIMELEKVITKLENID